MGVNVTTRYNCQCEVGMHHIHFTRGCDLICHDNVWYSCFFPSLVLWLSYHCLRFSLDRVMHGRPVHRIQSPFRKLGTDVIFQVQYKFFPSAEIQKSLVTNHRADE